MKLACIVAAAVALASCSHRPMAAPEARSGDDGAEVRAAEDRSTTLERELLALTAASEPPNCERVCPLVAQICALSQRICSLAHRQGDDADLMKRCAAGEDRCRRARDRGASCSCETGAGR